MTLAVLGSLGGVAAAVGMVVVVGKGIFRQVNATEENTQALQQLTGKVESLFGLYNNHERRISILEDRETRRWTTRPDGAGRRRC